MHVEGASQGDRILSARGLCALALTALSALCATSLYAAPAWAQPPADPGPTSGQVDAPPEDDGGSANGAETDTSDSGPEVVSGERSEGSEGSEPATTGPPAEEPRDESSTDDGTDTEAGLGTTAPYADANEAGAAVPGAPDGGAAGGGAAEGDDEEDRALHPPGELEMFEAHIADSVRFRLGSGLEITSEDELFRLTTRVRLQVLYTIEAPPEFPDLELMHELTLRRARLVFTGHFFGEDNRYKFELAVSPRDEGIRDVRVADGPGRTPLLDYYLEFRQLRELNFRVGQYKVSFNRQRVISSGNLQMVDRSIVNGQLNVDRDVGFDFRSRDLFGLGLFRYVLGAYMGRGRDAVGFNEFALMYLARLEVLPFGLFDDYSEVDFSRSMTPRMSIGAAFVAIDRAQGNRGILGSVPADGGTTNTQHFTADLMFMFAGFSLQSEFIMRVGQRNPGSALDPVSGVPIPVELASQGWGLMVQAGYLLPNLPFEVSGRFGTLQPLGDMTQTSFRESNELGLGLSYYVGRHPFKVQFDAFRLWGDQFDAGQTRLRIQLQASL